MPVIQVSPEVRDFDLEAWRLELKDLEDNEEGIPHPDTHSHNTTYTISGFTYARSIEIINGFTVEFEDGQYAVSARGANANVLDVKIQNQVSYNSQNSGGLLVTGESGLTSEEAANLALILKFLRNKRTQDPADGTVIVYDDDSITELLTSTAYEDVAGTQPYRGDGVDRVDRLE